MAQVAADQMERWLGIKATVQPEEPAAGYVRYESGDWKLGFHGNGILVMDPDQLVAGSYLTKATRNYSGWEPAEIRDLYDRQQVETDLEKRRELVLEIGDYLADVDNHLVITEWAMPDSLRGQQDQELQHRVRLCQPYQQGTSLVRGITFTMPGRAKACSGFHSAN
ncbi:hypothetical protein GBAR_LOCUS24363 [Geodia barretti]|uniref:Uncharacterized protein n=1 Tax=Geodia barretti TaxID=519541 RepID=A0AA35X3D6_GEOBA|nr:hypothetical protein GBAR_LOCUS24363 [Geodia barretti]